MVRVYTTEDIPTYTVKYYLDGTEQTSLRQTVAYGSTYTVKNLPAKTGHSVSGWLYFC